MQIIVAQPRLMPAGCPLQVVPCTLSPASCPLQVVPCRLSPVNRYKKTKQKSPSGKKEVFVDIRQLPIITKQTLPISKMKETESRRLWRHVTKGETTGACYFRLLAVNQPNRVKIRLKYPLVIATPRPRVSILQMLH